MPDTYVLRCPFTNRPRVVTAAQAASPAVLTLDSVVGLAVGDRIIGASFAGGTWTGMNAAAYPWDDAADGSLPITAVDTVAKTITVTVDASGFGTYTASSGTVQRAIQGGATNSELKGLAGTLYTPSLHDNQAFLKGNALEYDDDGVRGHIFQLGDGAAGPGYLDLAPGLVVMARMLFPRGSTVLSPPYFKVGFSVADAASFYGTGLGVLTLRCDVSATQVLSWTVQGLGLKSGAVDTSYRSAASRSVNAGGDLYLGLANDAAEVEHFDVAIWIESGTSPNFVASVWVRDTLSHYNARGPNWTCVWRGDIVYAAQVAPKFEFVSGRAGAKLLVKEFSVLSAGFSELTASKWSIPLANPSPYWTGSIDAGYAYDAVRSQHLVAAYQSRQEAVGGSGRIRLMAATDGKAWTELTDGGDPILPPDLTNAFTVQYKGADTSAVVSTLMVFGVPMLRLFSSTGGGPWISLAAAATDTLAELVAAINALGGGGVWEAVLETGKDAILSTWLEDLEPVACKAAAYQMRYATYRYIAPAVMVTGSRIILFGEKFVHAGGNLNQVCRYSDDGGATWSALVTIEDGGTYNCRASHAPVVLSSGRLVLPMMHYASAVGGCKCLVAYSDDDGETWAIVDTGVNGQYQGEVAERSDGTLLAVLRTWGQAQGGYLAYSTCAAPHGNGIATWTAKAYLDGTGGTSPVENGNASVALIAAYGKLFLVPNGTGVAAFRSARSFIDLLVSEDGGLTWAPHARSPILVSHFTTTMHPSFRARGRALSGVYSTGTQTVLFHDPQFLAAEDPGPRHIRPRRQLPMLILS